CGVLCRPPFFFPPPPGGGGGGGGGGRGSPFFSHGSPSSPRPSPPWDGGEGEESPLYLLLDASRLRSPSPSSVAVVSGLRAGVRTMRSRRRCVRRRGRADESCPCDPHRRAGGTSLAD